jgi:hypothetical protein
MSRSSGSSFGIVREKRYCARTAVVVYTPPRPIWAPATGPQSFAMYPRPLHAEHSSPCSPLPQCWYRFPTRRLYPIGEGSTERSAWAG